jgi:hypothetical protein
MSLEAKTKGIMAEEGGGGGGDSYSTSEIAGLLAI